MLGLTTQVPSTSDVAVPGRAPEPLDGVRFRTRSFDRRLRDLRPLEVAVLEVLRDPDAVEVPWAAMVECVSRLVGRGSIRPDVLRQEAADEAVPAVRERLHDLALS